MIEQRNAERGVHLPALLSRQLGISRSEARRLLATGGVKLDGKPIGRADVPESELRGKTLKVGKRREVRVP